MRRKSKEPTTEMGKPNSEIPSLMKQLTTKYLILNPITLYAINVGIVTTSLLFPELGKAFTPYPNFNVDSIINSEAICVYCLLC